MSLFASDQSIKPLAERLRPQSFRDLLGSINKNQIFANWIKDGAKQSAILWGPPGTGKTSIAELVATIARKEFIKLYAFDSGVKDLREIINRAKKVPGTILLFVDEVHNFNKSQQDTLLDAVEKGYLSFIGATTENPAVALNRALLSRTLKFELTAHRYEDLELLIYRAITTLVAKSFLEKDKQEELLDLSKRANRALYPDINNPYQQDLSVELNTLRHFIWDNYISKEALIYLVRSSHGDARSLLTNLETLNLANQKIELDFAKENLSSKIFSGDDNTYYDCVSALQKSMRGSDPDAAIYWLARLLVSGAELEQVARRILVTASEDVGLADSQALIVAEAAYSAALKLGMPEARIPLAQAVTYIAQAPKSNTSYKALSKAMADVHSSPPFQVPMHLRGTAVRECPVKSDNTNVNPITEYKYPHDYPNNWVEQQYMPSEMVDRKYL